MAGHARAFVAIGTCVLGACAQAGATAPPDAGPEGSADASPDAAGDLDAGSGGDAGSDAHPHAAPGSDASCRALDGGTAQDLAILSTEAAWIAAAQIGAGHGAASGAIPIHPDPTNGQWLVEPYFASFGALGMLAAGCEYASNVRAWIEWYLGHLESPDYNGVDGTVYDHLVDATTFAESLAPNPQAPHQTPWYDSTDSYAAILVSVVRAYAATTGDTAFVVAHRADVERVLGAMEATRQSDALTWAKPDYQEKYAMDNAEVERATLDAAWLYSAVWNDSTRAATYQARAASARTTFATVLWQAGPGMYSPARHSDGTVAVPSWSTWYPDTVAQAWTLFDGVEDPTSTSATSLWSALNAHAPSWTTTVSNPDSMPWAGLGYAAAVLGDVARRDAFLSSAQAHWIATGHPWPWNVQEAAFTAMAARLAAGG